MGNGTVTYNGIVRNSGSTPYDSSARGWEIEITADATGAFALTSAVISAQKFRGLLTGIEMAPGTTAPNNTVTLEMTTSRGVSMGTIPAFAATGQVVRSTEFTDAEPWEFIDGFGVQVSSSNTTAGAVARFIFMYS